MELVSERNAQSKRALSASFLCNLVVKSGTGKASFLLFLDVPLRDCFQLSTKAVFSEMMPRLSNHYSRVGRPGIFNNAVYSKIVKAQDQSSRLSETPTTTEDARKKILEGEVIAFSGVVREGTDMKMHPLYQCCVLLGAKVEKNITDRTTTLIAVKAPTEKCYEAKQRQIPIVTPKWIEECMTHWTKIKKDRFMLQVADRFEQFAGSIYSHPNSSPQSSNLSPVSSKIEKDLADLFSDSDEDSELCLARNDRDLYNFSYFSDN